MTAGYRWHVGTLVDGQITGTVPTISTSWQTVMDDAGSLAASAVLSDRAVRQLDLYTSAEPARCFLAVSYIDDQGTETFLEGGPVWSHSYDATSQVLAMRGAGLWSLWDHRFILPVLAAGQSPASVTTSYSGLSLATVAKRLLQLAATHTGGSVPVVLPADEAGSAAPSYPGGNLAYIGTELRSLAAADGGPEIQFVPRRQQADPTRLEWVMVTGTVAQPLIVQPGDDWLWDLTVARSAASGVTVNRDGSATANRWWSQGPGTDTSTMFGRADATDQVAAGFPLLESSDSDHSGDSTAAQATLDGYAAAAVRRARRPAESWTFNAYRDSRPLVSSYRVGHWVRMTHNQPYPPAGSYRSRITAIGGDDTNQVQITLQPEPS